MAETVDVKTQPFYLKKAKLKGYKSIKDAEIDFCDGLNIIIGKNASGKSNLLEILFSTLKLNTENHFPTDTELTLHGLKDLKIKANYIPSNRLKLNPESRKVGEQTEFKFVYDNHTIEKAEEPPRMHTSFIKFNIPDYDGFPIIAFPLNFKYYSKNKYAEIGKKKIVESEFLGFILNQLMNLYANEFLFKLENEVDLDKFKSKFISSLNEKIEGLNQLFYGLIPIEEIRFNPYINIHFEKESEIFTLNNLFIEYKVNGNWMPYSSLSDGTKRLFYIISEIYAGPYTIIGLPEKYFNFKGENINKNIVFIEEPELGIHPHQLHRLMTFIKEQSEEKQIILSTHSPMVLDVLGKDDLHRIIIASNDDPKKGSQFRHLTEAEKEKAKLYMKDYFLSDYWKHSDLER